MRIPGESSSQTTPTEIKFPDSDEIASIKFIILATGEIKVQCEWEANDLQLGLAYGEMLHQITSGLIHDSVIDILSGSYTPEQPEKKAFVEEALAEWGELVKIQIEYEKKLKSRPVVPPTKAMGGPGPKK